MRLIKSLTNIQIKQITLLTSQQKQILRSFFYIIFISRMDKKISRILLYFILVFHQSVVNCCLKLHQKMTSCLQCEKGSHLYRGSCIYDIPNCIAYKNGFDCATCKSEYEIMNTFKGSVCQKIINQTQFNFTKATGDDQALSLNQLTVVQLLSDNINPNLEHECKGVRGNSQYYKLIFSYQKGIFAQVYQVRQEITNSKVVSENILLELSNNQKFLDQQSPRFKEIIRSVNLQNSNDIYKIMIVSEQGNTFYRASLLKKNCQVQIRLIKLDTCLTSSNFGFGQSVVYLNNLTKEQNSSIWRYLSQQKFQKYLADTNLTSIGKKRIAESKIQYNVTYTHLSKGPSRKSYIIYQFDIKKRDQTLIKSDLYRQKFPLNLNPLCSQPMFPNYYNITFNEQIIELSILRQSIQCTLKKEDSNSIQLFVNSDISSYFFGFNQTNSLHKIFFKHFSGVLIQIVLSVDLIDNNTVRVLQARFVNENNIQKFHVNDLNRQEKQKDIILIAKKTFEQPNSTNYPNFNFDFSKLVLFMHTSYAYNWSGNGTTKKLISVSEKYRNVLAQVEGDVQFVQFEFIFEQSQNESESLLLIEPPKIEKRKSFFNFGNAPPQQILFWIEEHFKQERYNYYECNQTSADIRKQYYHVFCTIDIPKIGWRRVQYLVKSNPSETEVLVLNVYPAEQIKLIFENCLPLPDCSKQSLNFIMPKNNNTLEGMLRHSTQVLQQLQGNNEFLYMKKIVDQQQFNQSLVETFEIVYGQRKGIRKSGVKIKMGLIRSNGQVIFSQKANGSEIVKIGQILVNESNRFYSDFNPLINSSNSRNLSNVTTQGPNLSQYFVSSKVFEILTNFTHRLANLKPGIKQIENKSGLRVTLSSGITFDLYEQKMPKISALWIPQDLEDPLFYNKLARVAINKILNFEIANDEIFFVKVEKKSKMDKLKLITVEFKRNKNNTQTLRFIIPKLTILVRENNQTQQQNIRTQQANSKQAKGFFTTKILESPEKLDLIPVNYTKSLNVQFPLDQLQRISSQGNNSILSIKEMGLVSLIVPKNMKINNIKDYGHNSIVISVIDQDYGRALILANKDRVKDQYQVEAIIFSEDAYLTESSKQNLQKKEEIRVLQQINYGWLKNLLTKLSVFKIGLDKDITNINIDSLKYRNISNKIKELKGVYTLGEINQIQIHSLFEVKVQNNINFYEHNVSYFEFRERSAQEGNKNSTQLININKNLPSTVNQTQNAVISGNNRDKPEIVQKPLKRNYRQETIHNITNSDQFLTAQRLLFSQYGFYIPNKYVVDIYNATVLNENLFIVRYPGPQGYLVLEAQISFNYLGMTSRILSLTVAKPLPSLLKIQGCLTYKQNGQSCSECQADFKLDEFSQCQKIIDFCQIVAISVCIKCKEGLALVNNACISL